MHHLWYWHYYICCNIYDINMLLYTIMADNDHFKDFFSVNLSFKIYRKNVILSMFVWAYNVIKIRHLVNFVLWWYNNILQHPVVRVFHSYLTIQSYERKLNILTNQVTAIKVCSVYVSRLGSFITDLISWKSPLTWPYTMWSGICIYRS